MSRKLTTYRQPSISDRLAAARDIRQLAAIWHSLGRIAREGKVDADRKTVDRWIEACWVRVGELIVNARTPSEACYVFNATLRWRKPVGVEQALRATLHRTVRAMPNDVERRQIGASSRAREETL